KHGDKIFYETDGFVADSSVFDILTYEFTEGNPKTSLVDANSVVISEQLAQKLFGGEPALDENISISQGGPEANFKITGVFKARHNSHLIANFFTSMTSGGWGEYLRKNPEAANEWAGQNFIPAYVKLAAGQNPDPVIKKMNEVLAKYGTDDLQALGFKKTLGLEPVKDIYLKSDIRQSPRIIYIYVIGSIAAFILLIGCINFMNLSTAKAAHRAAEIGIRKVMGAFRSSLIRQILGEAMVIVILSMVISIVLVQLSLPFFNQLTDKNISFGTENLLYFSLALATVTIVTGVIAGSYPAFYISSFQPAEVLKGKFKISGSSGWLRRSLVVFQFVIAITLVSGMIIISKQLKFMQEKELGFDSHAKIIIPLRTESAREHYETLQAELSKNSRVQSVSATEYVPGSHIWSDMMFYSEGGNMDKTVLNRRNRVDFGYIELLNIPLIAGRTFTGDRKMESERNVILNRTSAKQFGIEPEKIVGQHLYFDWQGKQYTFNVVGVMEDFHQTSLKEEIEPVIFEISKDSKNYENIIASVQTGNFEQTIEAFEKIWKKQVQDTPFEYSFLDDNIQRQYSDDRKVSAIITSFTLIALLISCMGLYGLSSYMAERRLREIGVRKVMGASVNQIMTLMSNEFIKLVVVAFAVSVPIAWYAMNRWLEDFAYRISIDIYVFLIAGAGAFLIALLTISYESMKAALRNPVESLRTE
ncbi:MAG TPA: ABC transporter permease, partial [Cyclobacteriaceae bacterium]|nr:ABC transporter permease [Cyclobacteriaceae bacterium]